MSADNWRPCPQCMLRATRGQADRLKATEEAYGKVSPGEYARLLAEARKPPEPKDTLREDWEIGLWGAAFEVEYAARCNVCGLKFQFRHKVEVKLEG